MPGRGDHYEKYLETLDYWARAGWRVAALDWRGQAGSGRFGTDERTGHIEDFALWVADLGEFWAKWREEGAGPHVLAGHSMGGHLALRACIEGRVRPDALVLSAPMLGFTGPPVPDAIGHGVARLMCRIGDPRRPAWKWSEKPGVGPSTREQLLTHDRDRYADEQWWRAERPEIAMGPGSWGWVAAAYESTRAMFRRGALEGMRVPTFIFGTSNDRLVSWSAIRAAAERLPDAELLAFGDEAHHEILRETDEVRDRALDGIDAFLDRVAPAR